MLDAEATSFLMMGSLSPGMKKHSVTLFEGGAPFFTIRSRSGQICDTGRARAQQHALLQHSSAYCRLQAAWLCDIL